MKALDATLENELLEKGAGELHRQPSIRAAIVGATGYTGRELIALLRRHPAVRIASLMSSGRASFAPVPFPIEQAHPVLRGQSPESSLACHTLCWDHLTSSEVDLVFLATPPQTSHDLVPVLLERGLRVVDLSGAFRLKDMRSYARWYGFEHRAPTALDQAVYGLPEINGDAISKAQVVSNPGCYATSIILALAPLVEAGWLNLAAGIVCDAKSGASGGGRSPSEDLHFAEVNENCRAYALFNHRHVPEVTQTLKLDEAQFTFTPHLLPITRGILSTVYVRLVACRTADEVFSLYHSFYAHAPLVRVYGEGALPEIQAVAHTNYADLGFALDSAVAAKRLVMVSALDNLGKGAAGQAIQNMNLMFGLQEETGLA